MSCIVLAALGIAGAVVWQRVEDGRSAALPSFDEVLPEPTSYWMTFRGASWVGPNGSFRTQRSPDSRSIVVEIDSDGPAGRAPETLLLDADAVWSFDRDSGATELAFDTPTETWMVIDGATALRTFSSVVEGSVRPYLELVDEVEPDEARRPGAHDLRTYRLAFRQAEFCGSMPLECGEWFRAFGLDAPLLQAGTAAGAPAGLRRPGSQAIAGRTVGGRTIGARSIGARHLGERPAIELDEPDVDLPEGAVLLQLTVDEDGIVWDVELHGPRAFVITLDELSDGPFVPPTPSR